MSDDFLFDMETFFMALADKTRLRLLNLMREGEVCVCFFTEVLGESQPKISRHLAYLRGAGIVEARRDGKWMHYRIVRPINEMAALVLDDTLRWLESEEKMRQEYARFATACCAPAAPVTLARAPKPVRFAETNVIEPVSPPAEEEEELATYLL
ncbi:MAG: metalloregulator ArsR/SmtB family transcription factor [Acidobacteria bacterium]|nr:metalloregulator ArsR/SmtB family transcription factor [Acidobacteriota bacterium]